MKNIRCECGKLHTVPPSKVRGHLSTSEPLVIQCSCGHTITVPIAVLKGAFYGELTEDFISQF
jgi:hypothetical protein